LRASSRGLGSAAGAGGCSAESYQRSADRQVQEIVTAKRKTVTGREEPFPMKRMKIESMEEMERQFDSIVKWLKPKPYPTPRAIANSYEIATIEYPDARGLNPLSLWDLHWVKELDDEGFIDGLIRNLEKAPAKER